MAQTDDYKWLVRGGAVMSPPDRGSAACGTFTISGETVQNAAIGAGITHSTAWTPHAAG
jgi:hypothetical protein